jgi:hypothetical protein
MLLLMLSSMLSLSLSLSLSCCCSDDVIFYDQRDDVIFMINVMMRSKN